LSPHSNSAGGYENDLVSRTFEFDDIVDNRRQALKRGHTGRLVNYDLSAELHNDT
jgi:hypothetical protein